ncbi:ZIP zinc transporter-domain-containing protein [Collybia nuda]|uniref:ZIP zinc transporter-domain-containing protein n=1 Tax=Collybia nuda TaxID=64659 RepID=A0A9P6CLZ2_9AGAR|nr:ZIP zinc transporter-domain-containing protein [Collybia nuda]
MPAISSGNITMLLGDANSNLEPRIGVMFGILFISLFAVSFPGISKQIAFLRIPHLAFFIGKHFGTGVILSTAFCHLLPDAFESLNNANVKAQYHGIGKWTGMIILGSLLSIFLVEYASTSYVDHLHAEPSAPSTPVSSPPSSRPRSPRTPSTPSTSSQRPATPTAYSTTSSPTNTQTVPTTAPLALPQNVVAETTPLIQKGPKRTKSLCNLNHHRDEALLSLILLNSPRLSRGGLPHSGLVWGRDLGCVCPIGRLVMAQACDLDVQELVGTPGEDGGREKEVKPKLGRRRQVVGILVLQLGIMIHSLVIGLTLAVTSGADFTSLVTAIIFHQLFEGLSLGIRIASLPPAKVQDVPTLPSSYSESFPPPQSTHEPGNIHWLNPTLSILFAITTPFGMGIGLWAFARVHEGTSPEQAAHMALVQGLLSAVSAGMLIYAATVEMLAGDFVFGDIGGDHGHSHDHTHDHEHGHSHSHGHEINTKETKHGSIWRKVLAVASLLAGVAGMGLVGLGE